MSSSLTCRTKKIANLEQNLYICKKLFKSACGEMVDAPDLGSGPERGAGSSPARRTKTFFEKYNGQGGRRLRNIRPEMVGQGNAGRI